MWLVMGLNEHYETAYRMQCIHVCNVVRRRAVRSCFLHEPGCDRPGLYLVVAASVGVQGLPAKSAGIVFGFSRSSG